MTGKKSIMSAIKRAVSPMRQASTGAELQLPSPPIATGLPATTPFTRFVLDNLNLQNGEYKMFAMTFAPQIKTDCEAKVLDFDDCYYLLGHANKASALRTLLRTIPRDELLFNKDVENSMGRPRDVYRLNINQIEEVLLAANTDEGRKWRKLVLKIKNLVVQYMQMEMEMSAEREKRAQQQLEESDAKRAELEAVQVRLQATIESQRKREEKKEARKKQQKEPTETAYIMTNMPDDSHGPYKCGKTGGDAKKRAKEMQTGNHEEMRVVASVKCVDSKLVEDVMHRIFRDYRTNDKLEWFDTNLQSMSSVMEFIVKVIDGLNCVDHDEVSVKQALERITAVMEDEIFQLPLHSETVTAARLEQETEDPVDKDGTEAVEHVPNASERSEGDPYYEYCVGALEKCDLDSCLQWTELLAHFRVWHDVRFPNKRLGRGHKSQSVKNVKTYFVGKLGDITKTQRQGENVLGFFGWRLQSSSASENLE